MKNRKKSNPSNKSLSPKPKSLSNNKLNKTQHIKSPSSSKITNKEFTLKQNHQSR